MVVVGAVDQGVESLPEFAFHGSSPFHKHKTSLRANFCLRLRAFPGE